MRGVWEEFRGSEDWDVSLYATCEHGKLEMHRLPIGEIVKDDDTGRIRVNCLGKRKVVVDYRAAALEWIGEEPPDNYPGEWEQMIVSVIEQTVRPLVDAALFGPEK